MSYLHILQHRCIISVTLSRDLTNVRDPLVSVQGLDLYLCILFYLFIF